MADREVGRPTLISADLPGSEDATITLSLVNPNNVEVVTEQETQAVTATRRTAAISATDLTMAGTWLATWVNDDDFTFQEFTVGPHKPAGMTKFDLRNQIAQRVDQVILSEVTDSQPGILIDDMLVGGAGNFRMAYVLPDPSHPEAGQARRVTTYDGSGLVLNRPYETSLAPGERYALLRVDPREVDRAMQTAFADLSTMGRVHVTVPDVEVVDGVLSVPRGMTHVYEIWNDTTRLAADDWSMRAGRLVDFTDTTIETVSVVGLRHAAFPVWEDSIIDLDPAAVIARAAQILHSMRAGGSGTDANEHLRRQLAAQAEYEASRRLSAGRMPHGVQEVIN